MFFLFASAYSSTPQPPSMRVSEIPDYSTPLHFAPCLHRNVVVETTGSRTFAEGEVSDNIEEHVLCLECMCVLTEAEVRARWSEGWDVYVHQAVHSEL